MSAIEDVLTSIAATVEKISEAAAAAAAAVSEAEAGLEQAVAFGATGSIEGMTEVKDKLDSLSTELSAVSTTAEEAQTAAQGVADNT